MTERNEQQKAADKFREGLREAIHRLPRGVEAEVWTWARTGPGAPRDAEPLRDSGRGLLEDVEMAAAHIGTDGHGWADLRVGVREVRALLFVNVDEVELRGVTLDETQTEWLGMMDDVRRWVRGVTAEELIRADQEGWARAVEAESRLDSSAKIWTWRPGLIVDWGEPALVPDSLKAALAGLKTEQGPNPWLAEYQGEPAPEVKP